MIRFPPLLRPRLTWRYVLSASAVIYISYCFLVGSPLLASRLPRHTGPHQVGTIDIEVPVESRVISDLKRKDTGEPAFKLETVLFSLYYPAEYTQKPRLWHYWVPKPIAITAEGYASFGHANNFLTNSVITAGLWGLVGGIQIPAYVDADMLKTGAELKLQGKESAIFETTSSDGFPVVIFSHGFASSRTDYTHYLGELASRGYIVAAIEHRDGSCPASPIMKKGAPPVAEPVVERVVFPIRQSDIVQDSDFDSSMFKKAQLDFRQAEIEETVAVLRKISNGNGSDVFNTNSRLEGGRLQNWQGQLNMNEVTIAGHSFGATGALQALKGAPSTKLPFKGGIALDPGKSSGQLNDDINVPILVIHSNSWSKSHSVFFGRPHFDVVKGLVQSMVDKGKGAWFMTSLGTSHPSVTDAPLIEPLLLSWTTGATIDVKEGVEEYVRASEQFLKYQHTGQKTGLLARPVSHPAYDDRGDDGKELDEEYAKYWQVHVAPVQA